MMIQENIPLASLTTFKIGGPARYFKKVQSVEELKEALSFAKEKNLNIFILGGGSNILVSDDGFDGLVIKIEIRGVEEKDGVLSAGAGESWDALVEHAIQKNLWGIENLSGIPGTVGGAVVQNIGAYGQALSQTLERVEVWDVQEGKEWRLTQGEYQSGYRDSIFKREPGRFVVLRVALKLVEAGHPEVSYKDLAARFKDRNPSLQEIRSAVLEIRAGKFPDLSVEGSAGSFFKNPVLAEAEAKKLQTRYPELPLFPLPETTDVKVPLAWFLDYRHNVLDMRDVAVGGARLYEKQFLVLVAKRHTSAQDVQALAALVQKRVHDTLSIDIEPEVMMM